MSIGGNGDTSYTALTNTIYKDGNTQLLLKYVWRMTYYKEKHLRGRLQGTTENKKDQADIVTACLFVDQYTINIDRCQGNSAFVEFCTS